MEIVILVVIVVWGLIILLDLFYDGFKDGLTKLFLIALGFGFLYVMVTYGDWTIGDWTME